MNRRWIHIALAALATTIAQAQTVTDSPFVADQPLRPAMSMFMASVGHASILDSYLSPIRYKGLNLELDYEHMQNTGFDPQRWARQLTLGVEYDNVDNRVGDNTMHALMVDAQWGMMRRWQVAHNKLQVLCGPMTQARGGIIYDAANSNNVVSAKVRWSIGAMAMAQWNTRLARRPIALRYQASLPVVGVFFSPDYDESFYEIYLGNRSNLVHMGWWGNRFDFTQLLTADWHLGGTILRLGYRGGFETSWVNHLSTKIFTHSLVIGIGGEFLSVKRK